MSTSAKTKSPLIDLIGLVPIYTSATLTFIRILLLTVDGIWAIINFIFTYNRLYC